MPIQPYILVLAQTPHEAATYIRRAELPRGRWRIAARASSIRGIRQATVHCLPGFHKRPDRHSILGELRYAKCEWVDVEMPGAADVVVDQGDGMGQQLTFEDVARDERGPVLTPAELGELRKIPWTIDDRTLETAYRYNRLLDLEADTSNGHNMVAEGAPDDEAPKARRRRRCDDCGELHFKDEACPRTDGVEETPVANPATMFD